MGHMSDEHNKDQFAPGDAGEFVSFKAALDRLRAEGKGQVFVSSNETAESPQEDFKFQVNAREPLLARPVKNPDYPSIRKKISEKFRKTLDCLAKGPNQ